MVARRGKSSSISPTMIFWNCKIKENTIMKFVNHCLLLVQICISRWRAIISLSSLYTNNWYIFLTVSFTSVDGYIRICCWEPFKNAYTIWHIWMAVEAGETECRQISSFSHFDCLFCVRNLVWSGIIFVLIRFLCPETWFEALRLGKISVMICS